MAGSLNRVMLIGNLGADPEIRRMNSGDDVASFRIATSESWTDKNSGERREQTEWHSIVVFNQNLVKVIEPYVKKGSKVFVEGQLKTRKWQDQAGMDRYTTEIVLSNFRGDIQLLDKPPSNRAPAPESRDDYGSSKSGERRAQGNQAQGSFGRDLDDNIPF